MALDKNEQKEQDYEFVKERIIVERSPKKSGFFKRFFMTLFLGIVLGLVSATVFVASLPYLQKFFYYPENQNNGNGTGDDRVSIPLDDDNDESTSAPDDKTQTTEPSSGENESNTVESSSEAEPTTEENHGLTEDRVQEMIDKAISDQKFTISDYEAFYSELNAIVNKVNKSIVTVTITKKDIDILEHEYEVVESLSGIIYSITENNVYIMTDYSKLKNAESISVAFYSGCECSVDILRADESSNIAVICVLKEELDINTLSRLQAVTLGNSYMIKQGDPIIAVGNPMGYMYTMSYGIVTSSTQNYAKRVDAHYRMLNTNILKSSEGSAFLINLDGDLVGMSFVGADTGNTGYSDMITSAVAVSDIKKRLERISNDEAIPYFGIIGEDMVSVGKTDDTWQQPPQGIYVLQANIDSPAYNAGIQNGDIIVGMMADMDNLSMKSLRNFLETASVGDVVTVRVMRNGKDGYVEIQFEVVLGEK